MKGQKEFLMRVGKIYRNKHNRNVYMFVTRVSREMGYSVIRYYHMRDPDHEYRMRDTNDLELSWEEF